MLRIEFDNFEWFSQFYSEWRQASKLVSLKISTKVRVCDLCQNLKICSIHQENTCKSSSHSNVMILTDLHTFKKLVQTSKLVNLKISAKVRVCNLGQNLKMTKTF